MKTVAELQEFLNQASVADEVFELRPDYRAMLVAVSGVEPASSDEQSEALLVAAEASAKEVLATSAVEDLPNIAAWRAAYAAFGAKPQRTRNSAEALIRRAENGLPRVNRLTDIYNAISVSHQVPIGGEDLSKYDGAARLVRATGTERFDTVADGEIVFDHPEVGEVIWCDEAGVTCRRWNWRQGKRTQLTDQSGDLFFIIDALDPMTDAEVEAVADELVAQLTQLGGDVRVARRLIRSDKFETKVL